MCVVLIVLKCIVLLFLCVSSYCSNVCRPIVLMCIVLLFLCVLSYCSCVYCPIVLMCIVHPYVCYVDLLANVISSYIYKYIFPLYTYKYHTMQINLFTNCTDTIQATPRTVTPLQQHDGIHPTL